MNTVGLLMDAYYAAINGNANGLNVYKLTVPATETGNYVWIYPEGGIDDNNKSSKNEQVVIRVDIITSFVVAADQTICEDADSAINQALLPTSSTTGLVSPSGMQILNLKRENYQYLVENRDGKTFYRKVSRYTQRIHQTS